MEKTKFRVLVQREIGTMASQFEDPLDFMDATDEALRETGWSFPITDNFKIIWLKRRVKRHLFYKLYLQASSKFKVKQYNLDQKFKHYSQIIEKEDAAFKQAIEDNPDKFIGVDIYKLFGSVAGTGLVYDNFGNDVTDYDR